ncbi:M48 family metalloprotease [Echinicola soli]|uniref:M48 family metalloprotease n=1 Tax=Echinicola soli TaxID=2591634 RepID=A0A514CFT3_9BACT|nr:M48 family metallopeptidase [Echinicola soli]QDH78610.1 M48 family metalloprotease [Echinicola soli]
MRKIEIKLSPEFRTQTIKSIVAIGLFAFTYFLLLTLTIGLTVLCVYLGLSLVANYANLVTFLLGTGLASLGFLVLIFLLKFMFTSHKVDRSHLIEVKEKDEPMLFEMIGEIVREVETSFPKKVYLSADVNAAVFYDSNFWSMFLPIKKNLQIGMGLVNTVTKNELKAILAHEFGHFSQHTMKVGSYVHHVNQVIYNLLYENDSYEKIVHKWASITGYFTIFVGITLKLVNAIQWVLRKLYELVNKQYMALSREMEFHADEIAANVVGAEPLKSSLLRASVAEHSLDSVLNFYEGRVKKNHKSANIYENQSFVLRFLATYNDIPLVNELPEVALNELNKFNKSKLVIKDQWASHPSTEERIAKLDQYKVTQRSNDPAKGNSIFKDAESIEKLMTEHTFKDVVYEGAVEVITENDFSEAFREELLSNSFSKIYNGYYDHKNPLPFEMNSVLNSSVRKAHLNELFNLDKVDMVYSAIYLQNDIETLKQIAEKTVKVKTFDYDGKKYTRRESRKLIKRLEQELEEINAGIKINDEQVYWFFRYLAEESGEAERLEKCYRDFFEFDKAFDSKYELYSQLMAKLDFVSVTTPFDQIHSNFERIKPLEEHLKNELQGFLEDPAFRQEVTIEMQEAFEKYLSKPWKYFGNETYFDANLEVLFTAMNFYAVLLSRSYFVMKRNLLEYQADLIKKVSESETGQ